MGYRKHSGVEVEGIVVGRTSESGGHIRYPVKATITVHCADGRSRKGPAEYTIDEDPFGEMKADIVDLENSVQSVQGGVPRIT
jgi:hypothetical protein